MKKLAILLVLALLATGVMVGCAPAADNTESPPVEESPTPDVSPDVSPSDDPAPDGPDMILGTLYAVVSPTNVYEQEFGYEEGAFDPVAIGDLFTEWTGIDFSVSCEWLSDTELVINWLPVSALVAGYDESTITDGTFRFYDVDTLTWFMLNSFCRTVRENVGDIDVYYTMNDGDPLDLPDVEGASFSPGIAYNNSDNENVNID